jgi:hypothetical protein
MTRQKINPEVVKMIADRHEAHRRGFYEVMGAISQIETAAGILRFPVTGNVPSGPTIGFVTEDGKANAQKLIVLTAWDGIPDLFEKTEEFCQACLHDCHICGATGVKLCEGYQCGGRGWTPGPGVICPDCAAKDGKFNPECKTCNGVGEINPQVECIVCRGSGKMRCSFCRGKTRYSTGIKGGETDYMKGACDVCKGQQRQSIVHKQLIETHINALLPDPAKGPIVCIGPIFTFVVDLTMEQQESAGTPIKVFEVKPDGAGDQLFLLVDTSSNPNWPYLLGGTVMERTDKVFSGLAMVGTESRR